VGIVPKGQTGRAFFHSQPEIVIVVADADNEPAANSLLDDLRAGLAQLAAPPPTEYAVTHIRCAFIPEPQRDLVARTCPRRGLWGCLRALALWRNRVDDPSEDVWGSRYTS
jgi:hypothetical protein